MIRARPRWLGYVRRTPGSWRGPRRPFWRCAASWLMPGMIRDCRSKSGAGQCSASASARSAKLRTFRSIATVRVLHRGLSRDGPRR
jgi:hypothetical protein